MVVENDPPYVGGRYVLFLELATDEGITGLGERIAGSSYSNHLEDLKSQVSLIEELAGQFVIGEEYHPFWFEEPVPPENVDEMARMAAHTSIPIATGERLVTKYEFSEVLEKQAAQILQLDVGQCGGITEAKKIAGLAEAHYAVIAPHMYCGPVVAAAAIQIDTCSPNFLIQEMNQGPVHQAVFKEPPVFENGAITPPTGPGLGVELDMDVVSSRLVG